MQYVYPKLGGYDLGFIRILGHGLGNLLFPWARAVVASRDYNLKFIVPTWPQLKFGHFLRGESDHRTYHSIFGAASDTISGLKKIWLLSSLPKFSEDSLQEVSQISKSSIFIFSGMDKMFEPLSGQHSYIKKKLLEIVLPEHVKKGMNGKLPGKIGLHVRRGDFSVSNRVVPIDWYCSVVDYLVRNINGDIDFNVFSDGSPDELEPLLSKPHVHPCSLGSSIADLLAMSRCRALVGTAGSTFSLWAAYLGQMPTLWPHKDYHYKGGTPGVLNEYPDGELEWKPLDHMPPAFHDLLIKSIER